MSSQAVIHEVKVVIDTLFQKVLFNAEGLQCGIPFQMINEMTMEQIISHLVDFFAEPRPGYEGKMLSSKLVKELPKTIAAKIEQMK